jgi:coenzyme PQQ biosynthesis protein PqqD
MTTVLTATSIPRLPRGVRLHFDKVRDAHVLLAPERAFNVDATAVMVLKRVDGSRTIAEIAGDLATRFNADPAVIERDITRMLDDLVAKRVVEA